VTHVVYGDTVDAQLPDGGLVRVRLIGIDTPERGECGFDQASAYMESIALGRTVSLVPDPTQAAIDRFGRSLLYVGRDNGLDVGLQMVRAGWATVFVDGADFQRIDAYLEAEGAAGGGVWRRCDGDFHRSLADEQRDSAEHFVDRYYARVSNRRFRAAWGMLSCRVRRDFGSFRTWKAGHRRSLGVSLLANSARLSREGGGQRPASLTRP
jgi:endonuclease YncB( thermonuclease family)